jgi:hypothetical protein
MRFATAILCLLAAPAAYAQDEGDEPKKPDPTETTEAPKTAEPPKQEAASGAEDRPFQIRHGFFAEADLGVFFTFGGYDTTKAPPAKRALSNVQPYLGAVFGYDVLSARDYALSAGLKLAVGYSGGAARLNADEAGNPGAFKVTEKSADFAVVEIGIATAFAYHLTDRLALTIKADGGLASVDPTPVVPASTPGASSAAFSGMFGVGAGVEYFTLLNDFSVGLDLRFAMIFLSGTLENNQAVSYTVPAASISIPVKYTF